MQVLEAAPNRAGRPGEVRVGRAQFICSFEHPLHFTAQRPHRAYAIGRVDMNESIREMAGFVESANFSGRFGTLNGVASLTASRPDIIRSLLTVGYPSRKAAVGVVGPWRERMLVAMATGYLGPSLSTTAYFRNLEQTEKVGVSFLLGEAFTHWYAQARMNIEYLVHVAGLATCNWVSPSSPVAPKVGAAAPLPKSRPDFIGIRRRERHVFESKGRIRRPSASTISKALGQVSALRSINERHPQRAARASSC